MRRNAVSSIVLMLAFAAATRAHGSSVNISMNADKEVRTCGDVRIQFDGRAAQRAEDNFTLPAGTPLSVRLPVNSGIRVTGTNRSDFAVTVCKAADRAEALAAIRVSPEGSGLAFRGPSGDDWTTYLIVEAPKNAELDLEAKNGSIGVRAMAGRVTARTTNGPIGISHTSGEIQANAQNGPISLDDCSGSGEARAVNGPIHIAGHAGTYRLSTQNGPISVELDGDRWEGTLDARAVNGPLSLKLSDAYRSGVVVEATGHGPVSCPDSACRSARRTFDDAGRRIEFGDSEPVVRLSTRNGPVSIERAD
ncbi:MAG TPA: hypothetical protein VGS98_05560 [Thermoanaerobaculia bacterium]|jgi:hypothetical protein|nr:hypothetical protein [Thermoanaerobaculia bacterium]